MIKILRDKLLHKQHQERDKRVKHLYFMQHLLTRRYFFALLNLNFKVLLLCNNFLSSLLWQSYLQQRAFTLKWCTCTSCSIIAYNTNTVSSVLFFYNILKLGKNAQAKTAQAKSIHETLHHKRLFSFMNFHKTQWYSFVDCTGVCVCVI